MSAFLRHKLDLAEAEVRRLSLLVADTKTVVTAERQRCAAACDAFDASASDSDFVNGQATAAQQIRAAILGGAIKE